MHWLATCHHSHIYIFIFTTIDIAATHSSLPTFRACRPHKCHREYLYTKAIKCVSRSIVCGFVSMALCECVCARGCVCVCVAASLCVLSRTANMFNVYIPCSFFSLSISQKWACGGKSFARKIDNEHCTHKILSRSVITIFFTKVRSH